MESLTLHGILIVCNLLDTLGSSKAKGQRVSEWEGWEGRERERERERERGYVHVHVYISAIWHLAKIL